MLNLPPDPVKHGIQARLMTWVGALIELTRRSSTVAVAVAVATARRAATVWIDRKNSISFPNAQPSGLRSANSAI